MTHAYFLESGVSEELEKTCAWWWCRFNREIWTAAQDKKKGQVVKQAARNFEEGEVDMKEVEGCFEDMALNSNKFDGPDMVFAGQGPARQDSAADAALATLLSCLVSSSCQVAATWVDMEQEVSSVVA